ncbi:MAG: lysophospholipase [Chloroflexi bacterium HGW-Chloroflexi-5]|jgi:alpha-beta hydrolase superfamily lysophospholipase|nr:MAG: lysophospholipase [Chloroflexi bacterium HGW-Chloroflexi-5]
MQHSEFNWTTPDNVKLYGQEWKPAGKQKAAIAMVHGLGEHSGRYEHVAEAFTQAGYSLTAFDLRGHGKSEGIRGHAPSYAAIMEDITHNVDLAKEHFPGMPVFLYGHSLGGNLTLYYCLTQNPQIKGAIVTSPGLATAEPVPPVKLALGKLMYNLMPAMQMDNGLLRSGLSRDPEVEKIYSNDPFVHPKISARLALDLINNGKFIIDHAAEFPIPLLLMQGTGDYIVNPPMTKNFANAAPLSKITFKEWDGYYHELHNEPEKAQVLKTITDWIDLELK